MEWKGTVITKVEGQAKKLGIQPGWKIAQVDNKSVDSSEDVWSKMQEAKWEWRSCYVGFITNIKAIRNEQDMLKKQEMRDEEVRLMKLPFANALDDKHLSQVKEEFTFKGFIENVEDRSISLDQFKRLLKWSSSRCHRWRDPASPERSKTSGMKLHTDLMTVYHMYHWLIKPATVAKINSLTNHSDCSMIEMLTNQKQSPSWFIVHWWGDRLQDMAKCMELHSSTRQTEVKNFWISAFAVRPHASDLEEYAQDPTAIEKKGPFSRQSSRQSPQQPLTPVVSCFFKAIVAADYHVLFLLDSKSEHGTGPATPLSRAWCAYELLMVLDNDKTVLDIATCHPKPTVLTMGLTAEEEHKEIMEPGDGYKAKNEREKAFSIDMVEQALAFKIQNTMTTDPTARQKILNGLSGREPNEAVAVKHPAYDKSNARLCALFGLVMWRRVMSAASGDNDMQRIQTLMMETLRADRWRQTIDLDLSFVPGDDQRMASLMKNLPPNLKRLKLGLRKSDVTNEAMIILAANIPKEVDILNLDIAQNPDIDNWGFTDFINKLPGNINGLHMDLKATSVDKDFMAAQNSLSSMKQHIVDESEKGHLCLSFHLCPSVTGRMTTQTARCKVNC